MPETEAAVLVPEALRRNYKRIARITTIQQGTYALRDAFDEVNKGRIKVVLDLDYPHEARDFKPFILRLKALPDIDAVMANFLFGQVGTFARQLREANIELPIFGYHDFENGEEVKVAKGAMLHAWYAHPETPLQDFIAEYSQTFPDMPISFAAYGYDSVMMLVQALRVDGSSKGINNYLHTVRDFKGALGTYSASGNNSFTLPATLKIVTENGFSRLE